MAAAESKALVRSHAADRLAKAMVVVTASPDDPRTLTAWGQYIGVSRGALRVWCRAAGVSARSCLDFVRLLRAVLRSTDGTWDLFNTLDVVDPRSLNRLLERGGVRALAHCRTPPTVDAFLTAQHFLISPPILQAIARHLSGAK
jgi:hypothetical protein